MRPVLCIVLILFSTLMPGLAQSGNHSAHGRQQLINFLGVTMERHLGDEPEGAVGQLVVEWAARPDHEGMTVTCSSGFSAYTMSSIVSAIERIARLAGLESNSWNVVLRRSEEGYQYSTVYGDSLSAMVGLTVVALAQGDEVLPDRVLTGTVTPDGHLGPVSAVGSKIQAAHARHFRRVIVPETMDPADRDWRTPFLMQVSPLSSLSAAYMALTGQQMSRHFLAEHYGSRELSTR
jgi:predicted S18 family serine protease